MSEELRNAESVRDVVDYEVAKCMIASVVKAVVEDIDMAKVKAHSMAYMVLRMEDLHLDADMEKIEAGLDEALDELKHVDFDEFVSVLLGNEHIAAGMEESFEEFDKLVESNEDN